MLSDTIIAIATPPGQGGVGVVRLSGPESERILRSLFRPGGGGEGFVFRPRFMHHGWVLDAEGRALDEVLAVYMPGPASFTGEDVGEVHCHGSLAVLLEVLRSGVALGARQAGPGEFTCRAFLNGRMDLSQAEAVAEIIGATSPAGARLARAGLEGVLAGRVNAALEGLGGLRAQICLAVDFPDEEAEVWDAGEFRKRAAELKEILATLLAGHSRARQLREGFRVVLAGEVNVGKSSLLNAFLGRRRAIVSAQAGTTRDFLEEALFLDGLAVRLIDTAGLRESPDQTEAEGVRLSRELAAEADFVLLVLDAAELARTGFAPRQAEAELLAGLDRAKVLVVLNKLDAVDAAILPEAMDGLACRAVSARTGEGLEALAADLRARLAGVEPLEDLEAAPNLRQAGLLEKAVTELDLLDEDLQSGLPCDVLGARLESAAGFLGEITGKVTSDDILGRVFSQFCIGK